MTNPSEHLSLESARREHLFALRRFGKDLEIAKKLQPHFYGNPADGNPAGWLAEIEHGRRVGWGGHLDDAYVGLLDITPEADEELP